LCEPPSDQLSDDFTPASYTVVEFGRKSEECQNPPSSRENKPRHLVTFDSSQIEERISNPPVQLLVPSF
jgi:hypothetical protein